MALQPLLREHVADGERDRRLSDEVSTALADAGLLRILAPRRRTTPPGRRSGRW
ncbi:hypothetical protein QRX50_13970 [Amycolatopsis carbonis]|uniref:Acyl-CoA dehydrogenase/oxidase N-terminal domain-containing protein n=1 Tax=Amycolatopsis carbonis TaxID=715471 RepID=A0A9Y2IMB5_9PSEU|nr:hypothetical protein [Amycolatopsis sp. 2-15]WIX81780.1 hypothetical protein QRX50_13970 [Amycolatopsis sp. 2-15]